MQRLNYLHLHAFWAVAREGHLTRAAERLHVSPSALSTQIRQLEDQFGQPLFERRQRQLRLTEAGQLALSYAESIFSAGHELLALLREGQGPGRQVLRIGAVATLSRNFQDNLLRPLVRRDDVELLLQSGSLDELLGRLQVHTLDLVLANQAVDGTGDAPWRCRRIARQPVSLVGPARGEAFAFPDDIATRPLLLPSRAHGIRAGFDLWCEQRGLRPQVRAEVDDMAMLRLVAREHPGLAVVPPIVVKDELDSGVLVEVAELPGLVETFFAITLARRFPNPVLDLVLSPEVQKKN